METKNMASEKKRSSKLTPVNFKTIMAPVFTCFKNDEDCTLELEYIDRYARWLKKENVNGIMVNGIVGEGPALSLGERKLNAEAWSNAVVKYDLMFLVQIGGASLPDVLGLAEHAVSIGAQAVVCLPELYNRPRNIDQLVTYCKIVAKKCSDLPLLYYHAPDFTGLKFDMSEFCDRAQYEIPNFLGIQYTSHDIELGARCLRQGRVVMLSMSTMLASAMMLGFDSAMLPFMNGRPKLFWAIYNAMKSKKLELAKQRQKEAMDMINKALGEEPVVGWVPMAKAWFNKMMVGPDGAGFSAGPARKYF